MNQSTKRHTNNTWDNTRVQLVLQYIPLYLFKKVYVIPLLSTLITRHTWRNTKEKNKIHAG